MKRIELVQEYYKTLGDNLSKENVSMIMYLSSIPDGHYNLLKSLLPSNVKIEINKPKVRDRQHNYWAFYIIDSVGNAYHMDDFIDRKPSTLLNLSNAMDELRKNFESRVRKNVDDGVYQFLNSKNYYLFYNNTLTRINSKDQQNEHIKDNKIIFENNDMDFINALFRHANGTGEFFMHQITNYSLDYFYNDIFTNDMVDTQSIFKKIETTPIELSKINFDVVVQPNTTRVYVIKNDKSFGYFNVKDNEKEMFYTCERTNFILTNLRGAPNERQTLDSANISTSAYRRLMVNCTTCGATFIRNDHIKMCNACLEMETKLSSVFDNVDMEAMDFIQQPHTTTTPLTFSNVANETNPLFMGVELEVDSGYIDYDNIDEDTDEPEQSDGESYSNRELNIIAKNILGVLAPKGNAYAMWDGSLINGFEIATHPATLKSHLDNSIFNYKNAFDKLSALSIQSHESGTCGLHVHISRSFFGSDKNVQDLNATKLAILLETNWSKFVKFTRRNSDQLDRWAQRGRVAGFLDVDTTEELVERFKRNYSDKYVALNTQHRNTYEFRIFRGTTNYETFIATLMLVDNLARIVKDIDIKDLTKLNFSDIINYGDHEILKNYWGRRG